MGTIFGAKISHLGGVGGAIIYILAPYFCIQFSLVCVAQGIRLSVAKMFRQKYLTQTEIENLMDASSDEDETATLIRNADRVDLVLMPPEQVDEISDVEEIDEDTQLISDRGAFLPRDVAGAIEVSVDYNDCNRNKPSRSEVNDVDQQNNAEAAGPSKSKKKKPESTSVKWSKSKQISFSRAPVDVEKDAIGNLFQKYGLYASIIIT